MAVEDPTKKQIEEVDPEIAEILGLEDTFDFDQEEYLTLLKEKMVEARMNDSKFSSEQAMKITDEYKRVKNLKESTFTAPKKTINADSFFNKKPQEEGTTQKPITDAAKLLPGSGGALAKYQPPEPEKEPEVDKNSEKIESIEKFLNGSLLDIVKEIRSLTEDILKVFNNQAKANKKSQEKSRIEGDKEKKSSKEGKLEAKKQDSGSKILENIVKPFTSIFDTIKNFIMNVLLGSLVIWLLNVIKDPKKLLQPIQNLINGIVGFFNNVLQFIDNFVVKPVRTFINSMNSAISGFIQLLNNALKFIPGSPQIPDPNGGVLPNIPAMPQITPPDITGQNNQQPNRQQPSPKVNVRFGGGPITPTKPVIIKNVGGPIKPQNRKTPDIGNDKVSNEGGVVNRNTVNTKISGLGPDQYLTALSLDEYVLKPGAVDFLGGEDYLNSVNRLFGGTNQRKVATMGDIKIEAMNTGGRVGAHGQGGSRSSGSSPGGIKPTPPASSQSADTSLKLPSSAPTTKKTADGRVLNPNTYISNTKDTTYIKVGEKNPKSYILKYELKGGTRQPVYVIKQINKLVNSSFLGFNDKLTGVNVKSPEGQSVLASTNAKNWFSLYENAGIIDPKSITLLPHENSDVWFWYTRSYQANLAYANNKKLDYDKLKSQGLNVNNPKEYAALKATGFSMPKSDGTDLMPGDGPGAAPANFRTQEVVADKVHHGHAVDDLGTPIPTPTSTSEQSTDYSFLDSNFSIAGSEVDEKYLQAVKSGAYTNKSTSTQPAGSPPPAPVLPPPAGSLQGKGGGAEIQPSNKMTSFVRPSTSSSNEITPRSILDPTKTAASMPHVFKAAQAAREAARAEGLSRDEVEKRVIQASERAVSQGPIILTQNLIQPVNQPTIPGTPETKSSTTVLPMMGQGSNGNNAPKTGVTKTGTTPLVSFKSYDETQLNIVSTSSIYNIWGM